MICWCNIGGGGHENDGLAMYSPGRAQRSTKMGGNFTRGAQITRAGTAVPDDWCEKHRL